MSDDAISRQIGRFIRHHRMAQHKTQDALAKNAGISRSTPSLLERGETVTVATLIQVLRVLELLHVIDAFSIVEQQSPLLLARAEKKKRQRVTSSKKRSKDSYDEID